MNRYADSFRRAVGDWPVAKTKPTVLPPRSKEVFEAIEARTAELGMPDSHEEIAKQLGVTKTSIMRHITRLRKQGMIGLANGHQRRSIATVGIEPVLVAIRRAALAVRNGTSIEHAASTCRVAESILHTIQQYHPEAFRR
jgi:biotin operon repressor